MVNLVVRTALLDQLQGSHSTFGLVGSLQLIQLCSSDNQIDHSHVLGLWFSLWTWGLLNLIDTRCTSYFIDMETQTQTAIKVAQRQLQMSYHLWRRLPQNIPATSKINSQAVFHPLTHQPKSFIIQFIENIKGWNLSLHVNIFLNNC